MVEYFWFMKEIKKRADKYVLYISWIVSVAATAGSLIFSEVLGFAPCILCWYQRIAMYPLVVILTVGIILKDKKMYFYALPLALIGTVVAFLQELLQIGVISESAFPCRVGVSCTTKYFDYFGFITIPFLSLVGFLIITACLIYYWRLNK